MRIEFELMLQKDRTMIHLITYPGGLFDHFSNAAERLGVYTVEDYIQLLERLLSIWEIERIDGLTDSAKRAQDYMLALPKRLWRIATRLELEATDHEFKWIGKRPSPASAVSLCY